MNLLIIIIVLLVFIVVFLLIKPFNKSTSSDIISVLKADKLKLEADLEISRLNYNEELERRVKAEEAFLARSAKFLEQEQQLSTLNHQFQVTFQNIANQILDEKTAKFTEQNKENLNNILNPFKENIKAFEEKVDKVYKEESAERNKLEGVLKEMMDQSKMIQADALNLTKALKGDSKQQGNWGEVILERILERSGLIKDKEYRIQVNLSTSEGSRMHPDVVVDLPDEKHIIIDSKVSLVAYERFIASDAEEEKKLYLKQHIASIKSHINNLSGKNYQHLTQINSPDFVMLFIPIESSFGIAVQQDAEIFNYAWDKQVVIVSPSTLFATLRTIASIWKQERQNRNVLEIARLSGNMYDKFVGFLNDMDLIGKNIQQSQDAYEKAINKLSTGNGNLTGTSEKIKNLGAKANKQIDSKFLMD